MNHTASPEVGRAVATVVVDHPRLSADLAQVSQQVLQMLSRQLGMETCLLSLRDQNHYVVLQAVDPDMNVQLGPLRPWADTICGLMSAGVGPRVAGDVLAIPHYRALVERLNLPVRAYIGTPLYDAGGEVFGSLCALSRQPRGEDLSEEFGLLRTFGLVLGHMLDRELKTRQALAAESAALQQSRTDTLTGVLNGRGWQTVLQDVDRWCRVEHQQAAVFVIHVDNLEHVNNVEGHDAGDALLQRAASALTDCAVLCSLRRADGPLLGSAPSYAVARTGGDELAVLLPRLNPLECPAVADELRRALADGGVVASLGYALRHPVRGLARACRDADQLMLAEKRGRQSRRRALPSPRASPEGGPARSAISLARLDALLEAGGPRVALQPVVDLRSGRTVGVEALARFDDGRGPDVWFAEAAAIGQSQRLELAAFDAAVLTPIPLGTFLAVNVSAPVLMTAAFRERLRLLQSGEGRALESVVLELTEHEQVEDYSALAAVLAPFRAHGLRLAVDDIGAGHSSLSHVLQLRPDVMKLDRALVTAIDRDPIRRALVKSLRSFCADTQVELVAEGVETAHEARSLLAIGVQFAQGFHLGRPQLSQQRIA